MTFDDGILTIKSRTNTAANSMMPSYSYTTKASYYFSFDYLGFSRYYEALKAQTQLEHLVNIADWIDVSTEDICVLEDGVNYRIAQVQKIWDRTGLKITKLSLERIVNEL